MEFFRSLDTSDRDALEEAREGLPDIKPAYARSARVLEPIVQQPESPLHPRSSRTFYYKLQVGRNTCSKMTLTLLPQMPATGQENERSEPQEGPPSTPQRKMPVTGPGNKRGELQGPFPSMPSTPQRKTTTFLLSPSTVTYSTSSQEDNQEENKTSQELISPLSPPSTPAIRDWELDFNHVTPERSGFQERALRDLHVGSLSDVTVECEGHTWQAHMAVLAADSRKFYRAFMYGAPEFDQKTRTYHWTGPGGHATCDAYLRFLYTGVLSGPLESADFVPEVTETTHTSLMKNRCLED